MRVQLPQIRIQCTLHANHPPYIQRQFRIVGTGYQSVSGWLLTTQGLNRSRGRGRAQPQRAALAGKGFVSCWQLPMLEMRHSRLVL
ncbi:hypothetical protein, partial [Chitinimonas sp. BJB300]|uniref:hypothetical protein n=1 Tax=Chitinimonas sp. BJB300 TaxID=1559339 RepID=UPI001E451391